MKTDKRWHWKRGELQRWRRVQEHEHKTLKSWKRCYRCSEPTCSKVKVSCISGSGWKWVNWCGCSGEHTDQTPRWQYDCGHCKFAWCCGPLCACFSFKGMKKTPPARMKHVREMQRAWRKKRDRNI